MGRKSVHILSFLFIVLIGSVNIYTGNQITLKAVFLLLLYIYASNKNTSKIHCYIFGFIIAIVWSLADLHADKFMVDSNDIINLIVRIISLGMASHLIYKFKIQKARLNTVIEKLERVNLEKNNFVGMAAHDLRSPLNMIFSYTELLLDTRHTNFTKKQIGYIEIIRRLCNKMIVLLRETLDYTKIESGTLNLNKQSCEYISFVNEIIEANSDFAANKQINIYLITSETEINLLLDSMRVEQVLTNLISNAIKFSYRNSNITLKIEKAGNFVVTEVVDQGVGMTEKDLEIIFKPFQKASSEATADEDCNGLGLAIVKKIIESHGGNVRVSSKKGKGSNFIFTLPISEHKV